jgi:cytochrome c-type biogenesis protein CcmF
VPETLGNILLHVALVVAAYGIAASIVGGVTGRKGLVTSARNALWGVSALAASCSGLLVYCLLAGRYHLKYVYQYSNSTMPSFYKVAALWGGQEGSLLFWLLILCAYASLVMWSNRNRNEELLPYIITTLLTIGGFFLLLLVFEANPFETMPFAVRDGRGLNPLLQNYYMVIHPPSLYLGYVGMSIPFAYAIAALVTGRLDNHWIIQVRRWTLAAWFFLSMGNLLGASWAYEVLGWGGYWGWDPVENAAFIPWLSATAFLHSVIIQEKRGILKTWNMSLVVLSFILTMLGTFLTRSGIVSSVHSFAKSNIGTYFLAFLCLSIAVSVFLILLRLKELRSKSTLDSFLSRESAFLFNNLVLVGGAFAVLWGTIFPVLSEWVTGSKITVGPPFFNAVMIPIGLLLLLLTGIGPMVAWRKTTPEQLRKHFLFPVAALILASGLCWLLVSRQVYVVLSLSLCAFVLATIVLEYRRGIAARMRTLKEDAFTAFLRLLSGNKRRYGGYVVHFGIVLLFVGFTGSAFKVEDDLQLKVGEEKSIGRYALRYDKLTSKSDSHKEQVFAEITVRKNGEPFGTMRPSRVFFRAKVEGEPAQPYTNVAINRSMREDLYLALLSFDPDNETAIVKAVVNPLVQFIWIGGLFLILGTIIVMSPSGRTKALQGGI